MNKGKILGLKESFFSNLGEKAFNIGEYEVAKREFIEAIDRDDCERAKCNLGFMYIRGLGVEKDLKKGIDLLKDIAIRGNVHAQTGLGIAFEYEKEWKESKKWFMKAALQGSIEAQFHLGTKYEFGRGVKQNFDKATQWLTKVEKQGNKWKTKKYFAKTHGEYLIKGGEENLVIYANKHLFDIEKKKKLDNKLEIEDKSKESKVNSGIRM